jgi:molecular chaperone GrpE
MEQATKDRLLADLRAHLDALDQSPRLPGDEPPSEPDLFTLLAELAALKNEVKLESRQVKTALDEFRALFDALRAANERANDDERRRREQQRSGELRDQRDLLLELLEVRDRLQAGYDQALRFGVRGWFRRLWGAIFGVGRAQTFVASMAEGMALNLRRLDETLARRGVRPLQAVGQTFDPHRMHAAELAKDPTQPAGLVVAELRRGFLLKDQLLRPAEVVVNRPDADDPSVRPAA